MQKVLGSIPSSTMTVIFPLALCHIQTSSPIVMSFDPLVDIEIKMWFDDH